MLDPYEIERLTGLPYWSAYVGIMLFGSLIGSFLNVVIYRVPRELSVVFPNSACPKCSLPIRAYDNIPVISWVILRGRCRGCKEPISPRYPAVEAANAMLYVTALHVVGLNPFLPVVLIFCSAMVCLVLIDAEHMILPNVINFPLLGFFLLVRIVYPLVFGTSFFEDFNHAPGTSLHGTPIVFISLANAVAGAATGGGFLWAVGFIWEKLRGIEAMGLGDVKMMLAVGVLLGWRSTLLAIFLAAFAGAIGGMLLIALRRDKTLQTQIPFGIFLGIGSVVALLWGNRLIDWYLGTFLP